LGRQVAPARCARTTAQIARWQNLSFPSSLQRFSITRLQDDFHQGNKDQD
jgi:hypothetical protein